MVLPGPVWGTNIFAMPLLPDKSHTRYYITTRTCLANTCVYEFQHRQHAENGGSRAAFGCSVAALIQRFTQHGALHLQLLGSAHPAANTPYMQEHTKEETTV
jgi:hypothetical protein